MTLTQRSSLALLTTRQLESVAGRARESVRTERSVFRNGPSHREASRYLHMVLEELETRSNATRCECGALAVGTVDTGRDDAPVCAEHAAIEAAAGATVLA